MARARHSVFGAMFIMIIVSILLFWLPVIGPLIAGFAGGKKAGGVFDAILAVFLPAILTAIFLILFGSAVYAIPLFAFLAGSGIYVLSIMNVGPLLVGAIIGGALD